MKQNRKYFQRFVTWFFAALAIFLFQCGKKKELPSGNLLLRSGMDSLAGDSFPGIAGEYSAVARTRPAVSWGLPVGDNAGVSYYKIRGIIPGDHYGEDWNGTGGGNTDMGDLVLAVADGVVFYSGDFRPGWGNVVRMIHNAGSLAEPKYVESLYAHLSTVWVDPGNAMKKGEPLGTIGSADGVYHAHLHFEIRTQPGMPIPWPEGADTSKFVSPSDFIREHSK